MESWFQRTPMESMTKNGFEEARLEHGFKSIRMENGPTKNRNVLGLLKKTQ